MFMLLLLMMVMSSMLSMLMMLLKILARSIALTFWGKIQMKVKQKVSC